MFITILPSYVASCVRKSKSYVTRMDSCGVLVAIVAYKTSHLPLAFVITLENPRKRNRRTAKKNLEILPLHGWCTKEEEAKRNTQFIDT